MQEKKMGRTALVVGASGIAGSAAAAELLADGWTVLGLARRPVAHEGVVPVAADLQDQEATRAALRDVRPDAVFFTTWSRQATEVENIRVNAGMVRVVLDAVRPAQTVAHVALVTGLKHYLGPFEAYGKGVLPQTPFREAQGRLNIDNFYYAQEDEVFSAAARDGFAWSVHRPHTIIGKAVGNAMNMGTTLAVYASLCRETGRPFRFPGSHVRSASSPDDSPSDGSFWNVDPPEPSSSGLAWESFPNGRDRRWRAPAPCPDHTSETGRVVVSREPNQNLVGTSHRW